MTRHGIFNKFKLNQRIFDYATMQNDRFGKMIEAFFNRDIPCEKESSLQIIVNGTFEKVCMEGLDPREVIEKLADLL